MSLITFEWNTTTAPMLIMGILLTRAPAKNTKFWIESEIRLLKYTCGKQDWGEWLLKEKDFLIDVYKPLKIN